MPARKGAKDDPDSWTNSTPPSRCFRSLLVTGVLGGGAAFLAGRAIAQTWRPFWNVVVYMAMLGAAVRFVHFALFEGRCCRPRPTLPTRSISSSSARWPGG